MRAFLNPNMEEKVCPSCFQEFRPENDKCSDCGADLVQQDLLEIEHIMPTCPKCGELATKSHAHCPSCNHRLFLFPVLPKALPLIIGAAAGLGFLVDDFLRYRRFSFGMLYLAVVIFYIVWKIIGRHKSVNKPIDLLWCDFPDDDKREFRKKYLKKKVIE